MKRCLVSVDYSNRDSDLRVEGSLKQDKTHLEVDCFVGDSHI